MRASHHYYFLFLFFKEEKLISFSFILNENLKYLWQETEC